MITKKELLEILEDIEEDEEIIFIDNNNSKLFLNIVDSVKVIDHRHRSDLLIHKVYIDLKE